jgi:RNA polymerase sigma-70 factor (ECF subfamily)
LDEYSALTSRRFDLILFAIDGGTASAPGPSGLRAIGRETQQHPHAVSMQEKPMSTPLSGASSVSGDSRLTQMAVAKAKAGDPDGIHYLYVRYADDVRRYVATFVKDQYEAEDITHNVFAKLMTAITKYEERSVPFLAWILRVARNASLDYLRAKRMIPTEEVRLADTEPIHDGGERGRDIKIALESLPEDQREVLVLRHIIGLSPTEIAGTLDKTESSIHGLHHRGRRALRGALAELGARPVVASAA